MALLNMECDIRAKEYWSEQLLNHKYFHYNKLKGIWIVGTGVCNHLQQDIKKIIEGVWGDYRILDIYTKMFCIKLLLPSQLDYDRSSNEIVYSI